MKSAFLKLPRNVYLLSVSQVLGMSATTLVFLIGGLIGAEIAPSPRLATLPITLLIIGLATATIPAVMLMKKIGRKKSFILSVLNAAFSCLLAAYAITQNNFYLFCFSTFLLGTNGAFIQQYRFAAFEATPKEHASKAVSLVLMAGILAGLVGPEIAKHTKDVFSMHLYAGSFIIFAGIFLVASIVLSFLKDSKVHEEKFSDKERPLRDIMMQPRYLIAVLAAAISYGVMTFIMTATPIHMHRISHYSFDQTVLVNQSHIFAMFLPSLITGILIERFGIFRILLAGLLSFFATVFFAVNAHTVLYYWLAVVLLGIGWNFLFISSTILLAQNYSHVERFKAQGMNDFIVVLSQMFASFFAGSLLFSAGWMNLILLTLPFIVCTFIIFVLKRKQLSFSPSVSPKEEIPL